MKLEKAIEIKEAYLKGDVPSDPYDLIIADRLSIEAMKRVALTREQHLFQCWILLPGETDE